MFANVAQLENSGRDWGRWLTEGDALERVLQLGEISDGDAADKSKVVLGNERDAADPLDGVLYIRLGPFEGRILAVPPEKAYDPDVLAEVAKLATGWGAARH